MVTIKPPYEPCGATTSPTKEIKLVCDRPVGHPGFHSCEAHGNTYRWALSER